MFISFSKTVARFGGFRLGFGMRLNKKNAVWAWLVLLFVGIFQLLWSMFVLCGWLIYAMFYGLYWCTKKLISALSKRQVNQQVQTTTNESTERKEDSPIMTPETNNSQNETHKNNFSKNKATIARWIVGGCFAMFALVNGFHFSSLFLLCAAFLMFPLPFMNNFYQSKNIKPMIALILSIALFFAGVLTSPPTETTDSPTDDTTQTTTGDDEKNNNSAKPDSSTTKPDSSTTTPGSSTTTPGNSTTTPGDSTTTPGDSTTTPGDSTTNNSETTTPDNSTNNEEKVQMVWVASSGTKYHSKSSCSNMTSPRQISLEDAKEAGYTACKKCH